MITTTTKLEPDYASLYIELRARVLAAEGRASAALAGYLAGAERRR